MKSTSCDECEAIILEYRRACIEFWLNSSDETRDACRAIGQLVAGCREADAAHAEELLRPFKPLTFESKMNRRAGSWRLTSAVVSIRLKPSLSARAHHG
jgi:hypothetical protein